MITVQDMRGFLTSRARRHNFYCYSTLDYAQESAIFILMVHGFQQGRRKRQAQLISDWFFYERIPRELARGGFIAPVNLDARDIDRARNSVGALIGAMGRTFADKVERHGFLGAIGMKMRDTRLPEGLFDMPWGMVMQLLCSSQRYEPGRFNPDAAYQPNPAFGGQMQALRRELTQAGFDPDSLGLY